MRTRKFRLPELRRLVILWFIILGATLVISSCQSKEAKKEAKKEEHYQKGLNFVREGKLSEAIIEFKNAIQQDPNFANAYYDNRMVNLIC